MATDPGTVAHILDCLSGTGCRARAMFGEYVLYCDDRVVALICDDSLFLKDLPAARALIADPVTAPPYPGAKPHIQGDFLLDEPERLRMLVRALADALPAPRPRKPRIPKARSRKG